MTTEEFERIRKEFGNLSYWEHALKQIREVRKNLIIGALSFTILLMKWI